MYAYGLFFGQRAEAAPISRISQSEVEVVFGDCLWQVEFDHRAEPFANLIFFEGYLLRDGLPGGTKLLNVTIGECVYGPGGAGSGATFDKGGVKENDVLTGLPRDQDEIVVVGDRASVVFAIHALQFPRSNVGVRGLVMRPKPRSLEREYIRIVSKESEVLFETCVTF